MLVCESLARLALATSARTKPRTPQEHAGLLYLSDPAIDKMLHKYLENEDEATAELNATREKICTLALRLIN